MADKMLRMAIRDKDGRAKPVELEKILKNETVSSQGITLAPDEEWESETFRCDGLNVLSYYFNINTNNEYTVRLIERLGDGYGAALTGTSSFVIPPGVDVATRGRVRVNSPSFRILIKNIGTKTMNVGTYLMIRSGK